MSSPATRRTTYQVKDVALAGGATFLTVLAVRQGYSTAILTPFTSPVNQQVPAALLELGVSFDAGTSSDNPLVELAQVALPTGANPPTTFVMVDRAGAGSDANPYDPPWANDSVGLGVGQSGLPNDYAITFTTEPTIEGHGPCWRVPNAAGGVLDIPFEDGCGPTLDGVVNWAWALRVKCANPVNVTAYMTFG